MSKELNGVKLYVDWTAASQRANILPGTKVGGVHGEALATSLSKISKWFTDIENTGIFGDIELTDTTYTFTSGTDGSFSVISDATGATSQTVRVLPTTAAADEGKVLMVNSSGAPVYTEQAWIENTVDDLVNYYKKYVDDATTPKTGSTYSASEIDGLLAPKLDIKIVQTLPTKGDSSISKTSVYMVPSVSPAGELNTYDEYVYINKGTEQSPNWDWEKIGVQKVDLANYVQFTDVTDGDGTSGLGTFYVGSTAVTVYGLGSAAAKNAATEIVVDSSDDEYNATSNSVVPTVKAVVDFIDTIDTGVAAVTGTPNQINVSPSTGTGVVAVSLADINTYPDSAASKSVGPTADVTGSEGQTVKIPAITVDKTGRVTAVGERTLTTKDAKVAQTTITNGSDAYYPLLFGNTGASTVPTGGTISTTTETAGAKKTGRLYVNVGDDGVTTLYADIFKGLVATQAITSDDNSMASTAFVHDVVDDAMGQSIADKFNGAKGITVRYDATAGKTIIEHSHTDITASSTATFAKVAYDAQGHLTGTTAVTAADIRGLTPYSGTADEITLGNDGAIGLANVPANTTDTATFVKVHVDAKGRVDRTANVTAADITGLSGIGMTGATSSTAGATGLVPAPAAGDDTKFLTGAGTWATPDNDNTTYTLSGTTVGTGSDAGKLIVTLTDSDSNTSTAKIPTFTGAGVSAAGTIGLVPAPASGDTNKWLKSDGNWTTLPITSTYTAGDTTNAINAAALDDALSDLIIHCVAS